MLIRMNKRQYSTILVHLGLLRWSHPNLDHNLRFQTLAEFEDTV
jgi:hypothetical protein